MSLVRRLVLAVVALLAVALPAEHAYAQPALPFYVAVTWNQPRAHFLDNAFNELSSFGLNDRNPNGVGASATLIYSGHFSNSSIVAYNYAGVEQFRFSDATRLSNLQGLAYTGAEVAAASGGDTHFFDALTGAYTRSFANSGSAVEGLALHSGLLWELGDQIIGRNLATGATVTSFANAAASCVFGGTGLASGGAGALAIACENGRWYRVSDVDGSVLATGNNGLDMYGLTTISAATVVPEPARIVLMAIGLGALGGVTARRRRSA